MVVVIAVQELFERRQAPAALGSGATGRDELFDARRAARDFAVDLPVGHRVAIAHVHARRLSEPNDHVKASR